MAIVKPADFISRHDPAVPSGMERHPTWSYSPVSLLQCLNNTEEPTMSLRERQGSNPEPA